MLPILQNLDPTTGDIGINLLDLTTQQFTPLSQASLPDVQAIEESNTETFEVGWTGIIGQRLKITGDVYWMKKNNFVSPLLIQTPMIFLDGQDVGAFITGPIVQALTQQLIAAGLDPQTAQQQAAQQAGRHHRHLRERG